ncbi:pyridoxal-phosphate dependent enzyme [Thermodesulfobacteriota bacterium]
MTKDKRNIWYYANRYTPFIEDEQRLTLGEGGVRCAFTDSISAALSDDEPRRIILKREDENPTGSHKARALSYQVSYYNSNGHKRLLISSSGNAAIAAAKYCSLAGIQLMSFVDKRTDAGKLLELKSTGQPVIFCKKPINFAKYASRIFDIPNLRPSHDDLSIEPYKSIAFELFDEFDDKIDAVFMFPTSASSLIGMVKGYLQLRDELALIKSVPKVIAVQTGNITSIARSFCEDAAGEDVSVAGALGVKVTARTKEAVEHIRALGGSAIIVSADDIREADSILRDAGIVTSMEGAACVAGAKRLKEYKNVVCILSGRVYDEAKGGDATAGTCAEYYAESYSDVKNIVERLKI